MIDIRLIRENPDLVRENIRKKFQDAKLPLVDEVIELDKANRAAINEASNLRAERNSLSKKIGMLMGQAKKDPSKLEEAEAVKAQVTAQAARLAELEKQEEELEAKIHKIMLTIPQIIDPSVPLGPDDSCNVEVHRFGEAVVPDCPPARGRAGLRARFHDRQGLYLLHPAVHDPRQRGRGRHEPDGHGRHDVQD